MAAKKTAAKTTADPTPEPVSEEATAPTPSAEAQYARAGYPKGSRYVLNIRTGTVQAVTKAHARYLLTKQAWCWRTATKAMYAEFEKYVAGKGPRPVFKVDDDEE